MYRHASIALALLGTGLGCQGTSPDLGEAPEIEAPAPVLRRLTQTQYENVIADLFADDIVVPPDIEPDARIAGLRAVGAATSAVSPRGVERYEKAAYDVAEQVLGEDRRGEFMPCEPVALVDDECAAMFLEEVGLYAWRRPLTDGELDVLVGLAGDAAATLEDFHEGLQYGLAAMLQSPEFLMRPEFGEEAAEGHRRYTDHEMATRLSFFLWNTIPDAELMRAAADGELTTDEGLRAQAERMLADPRARTGMRSWVTDWLHLYELDKLYKDPGVFPHMSEDVGPAAREETLLGFEEIVFEEEGDLRDILTTRRTFVDRNLASIYDVKAPQREGFGEVVFPEDGQRGGLLTQVSMLAQHSHPVSTSATLRGMFVRESLLCEVVPPPPGDVDTSIPEPTPDAPTLRDRIDTHLSVPVCASCHLQMDPIGLALEHFDGIGRYRALDNGAYIDTTGDLDGMAFEDVNGLAARIRHHPHLTPCLVEQVSRYAMGRTAYAADSESLDWLTATFESRGHQLQPLWMDVIMSPMFRWVGEVE